MIQQLASAAQILKANRSLPAAARQNMVLLRFAAPIPKAFAWEFLRIRLTHQMLAGGEDEFFHAEVHQPQHALAKHCSACNHSLTLVGPYRGLCANAACVRYRREETHSPKRGVVRVLIPSDHLQLVDGREVCGSIVLVLDRRYREEVLAAVYRTAGMICDDLGWKLC